jgi:hypothetical protein
MGVNPNDGIAAVLSQIDHSDYHRQVDKYFYWRRSLDTIILQTMGAAPIPCLVIRCCVDVAVTRV